MLGATSDDIALLATALSVHQLLSKAAEVPQVLPAAASESPNVVEPTQPLESSRIPTETVAAQLGSDAIQIPPQSTSDTTDLTAADSPPTAQYRTRIPANTVSEVPISSRRGSIDGAPEVAFDLQELSKIPPSQDLMDFDTFEVDLSDYIRLMEESDNETHVSSSQKSVDGCQTPLPPPPPATSQLSVDEGDLPSWMVKKGQWKYIASTAGGPAWEKLLKTYMAQERRLEFTDKASNFTSLPYLQP